MGLSYLLSTGEEREYFPRAEEHVRRFREASEPAIRRSIHEEFKALPCPDAALSYHWAVSEAMRHEIAQNAASAGLHHERAAAYWREAERRRP